MECDYEHRPVHEVHTAGEKHPLGPLVILRGRWQHLEAWASGRSRCTSVPNDRTHALPATN